jgi:hypothetical protein
VPFDVEISKKHHCNCPDGTKLDNAVSNDAVLIDTATLICFGIISETTEDLRLQVIHVPVNEDKIRTGTLKPGRTMSIWMPVRNRSDQRSWRRLCPRQADVAEKRSIARSRKSSQILCFDDERVKAHREHLMSSLVSYVSKRFKDKWAKMSKALYH